jgi:hypothetical protein
MNNTLLESEYLGNAPAAWLLILYHLEIRLEIGILLAV